MSDVLVSARMSKAKKDAAVGVLQSIGSSASELINSAFDYVIANKTLPGQAASNRKMKHFDDFVNETSFNIDWPQVPTTFGEDGYKVAIREERLSKYESLA